jgi:hypothetical protein
MFNPSKPTEPKPAEPAQPAVSLDQGALDRTTLAPVVPLGRVVCTPHALDALIAADISPDVFLGRHQRGDWGDVSHDDQTANNRAMAEGARLLSAYTLPVTGQKIWVITEADRSSTCILLPSEY